MNIKKPLSLNEIGGRENNEDSVFPLNCSATEKDRLFMVCDGVGGSNKGEVASALLCKSISEYFKHNTKSEINNIFIKNAVAFAESEFDNEVKRNPEYAKMSSTLSLLYLNADYAMIAWVGDSRIYQIRKGKIIFKSQDHSLVNFLIKTNQITEDEAKNHPKKNQILKAIQSSQSPTEPEVIRIDDIQKDDYFFLCTDGILENISDEILCNLFNGTFDNNLIQSNILRFCNKKTKDNFSMYFIQVASINKSKTVKSETIKGKFKIKYIFIFLIGLAFIITTLFIANRFFMKNKTETPALKESTTDKLK